MPLDPRLDKIRKLMALALNNPNEEEARSAALKAVQMMTDLACTISLSQPAAPAPPQMPQQPPYDPARNNYEAMLRNQYGGMGQEQAHRQHEQQYQQAYGPGHDAAWWRAFWAGSR